MPWTLSHSAAVLPLRRLSPKPFDFPALVVGSMTPDFGYYIGLFGFATYSHSLAGSVIACLPTGLILLLVLYRFCRPVCYVLPSPHRQALLPLCPEFPQGLARWTSILISLLVGTWTHILWDSFTHEHGWFVRHLPWLQRPILRFGATVIYTPFFLQVFSTFAGFFIVAAAYFLWLRRQPSEPESERESDGWRYLFWIVIAAVGLLVALPFALHFAASRHGFLFVRAVLFRTALFGPDVAVPLSLVAAAVIYARRRRSSSWSAG